MQTIQIRRGNSNVADSRGAGKKTSAGKQAGQGSSTGRSGQKSSRRAQSGRPQRTRDREAEATIREMREGDVNRRQTVSRQKQRRLKQMRSRLTVLSACIVIAVTCGAFFGAVDAGWLEGGETAAFSPDGAREMPAREKTVKPEMTAERRQTLKMLQKVLRIRRRLPLRSRKKPER